MADILHFPTGYPLTTEDLQDAPDVDLEEEEDEEPTIDSLAVSLLEQLIENAGPLSDFAIVANNEDGATVMVSSPMKKSDLYYMLSVAKRAVINR